LYDQYNYPSVTLFEWDSCEGESSSYGVRNFTYNPTENQVYEEPYSSWVDIGYPAEDANSFFVPYNVKIELYDGNDYKGSMQCEDKYGCGCMCLENNHGNCYSTDFDTVYTYWLDLADPAQETMQQAMTSFTTCLKSNPGSDGEVFCAAQDKCLEANDWNTSYCTEEVVKNYEHPNWVAGNCD
jgi:hypothetical protein